MILMPRRRKMFLAMRESLSKLSLSPWSRRFRSVFSIVVFVHSQLQMLLRDLQHFRRSSISLIVHNGASDSASADKQNPTLKKPQILQGYLKKQGEKVTLFSVTYLLPCSLFSKRGRLDISDRPGTDYSTFQVRKISINLEVFH